MMRRETNPFDRDREFAVILENLHSRFDVLAEGQSDLRSKFDMMYAEFGRQKEELFVIRTDVRFLKDDVSTLKENVAVLKTDVTVLKDDMRVVKTDIGEIKGILTSHDNRLSHLEVALN